MSNRKLSNALDRLEPWGVFLPVMGILFLDNGKPACWLMLTLVAETLPPEVEGKVRSVPGVAGVELELVWEPPWSMDMMSEAARLSLNM